MQPYNHSRPALLSGRKLGKLLKPESSQVQEGVLLGPRELPIWRQGSLLVMLVSAPSALFIQACFLYFFKADLPSCHGTHLNVIHTNGQERRKWRKSNIWWLNHITHHFSYPSLTQPTVDIIQWLTVSESGWQNSLFIPSFAPIGTKWWLCIYPRQKETGKGSTNHIYVDCKTLGVFLNMATYDKG